MNKINISNAPAYTSPNSMTLICTEKPDGSTNLATLAFWAFASTNPGKIMFSLNKGAYSLELLAEKKEVVCIKENISIFIDDSFKHCSAVAASGIKVLMPSTIYNKKYLEFPHFTSWQEVPTYIKSIELETGE